MRTRKTQTKRKNATAVSAPRHGSTPSPSANPGAILRRHRTDKALTLLQLSERTGLPISTISKLETGRMSLTYEKLLALSHGLEIDIAKLISFDENEAQDVSARGRRSITRADQPPSISTGAYTYTYPASDLMHKALNPMVIDVQARSIEDFGEFMRHPGDEYVYVIEGTVELHTDIYAPQRLSKGDSAYYDGGMGHAFIAVGDEPARILSVCSATFEDLKSALSSVGGQPIEQLAGADS